jgi:hypothetical protein
MWHGTTIALEPLIMCYLSPSFIPLAALHFKETASVCLWTQCKSLGFSRETHRFKNLQYYEH